MSKLYVGIDNGVSGSIGILLHSGECLFYDATPVKTVMSYNKHDPGNLTRIDFDKMKTVLEIAKSDGFQSRVFIERPMIHPGKLQATLSSRASLEATWIILEQLQLPYTFITWSDWQKQILPTGLKGPALKKASLEIGNQLFPSLASHKHKDRDGLLIAEWARRNNL